MFFINIRKIDKLCFVKFAIPDEYLAKDIIKDTDDAGAPIQPTIAGYP